MTAPDEDPAIATLLEEAAQLATAANEKLESALLLPSKRGVTRLSTPIAIGSSRGAGS
jgi:hypothetical protein